MTKRPKLVVDKKFCCLDLDMRVEVDSYQVPKASLGLWEGGRHVCTMMFFTGSGWGQSQILVPTADWMAFLGSVDFYGLDQNGRHALELNLDGVYWPLDQGMNRMLGALFAGVKTEPTPLQALMVRLFRMEAVSGLCWEFAKRDSEGVWVPKVNNIAQTFCKPTSPVGEG